MKAALLSLSLASLRQSRSCKTLSTLRLAGNCNELDWKHSDLRRGATSCVAGYANREEQCTLIGSPPDGIGLKGSINFGNIENISEYLFYFAKHQLISISLPCYWTELEEKFARLNTLRGKFYSFL